MRADQSQAIIHFRDSESDSEAFAIVRKIGDQIGLAVSIMKDGDIEVFLDRPACLKLIQALQEAMSD